MKLGHLTGGEDVPPIATRSKQLALLRVPDHSPNQSIVRAGWYLIAVFLLWLGPQLRQQDGWLVFLPSTAMAANVQFAYDALGRLIQAANSTTGQATVYAYDAAGNITSQNVISLTTLSVSGFMPMSGVIGSQVVISGTGFNATPTANIVKFNGTTAVVVAASPTQLKVTVPTGASSGTLSVTVASTTAASAVAFTVLAGGSIAPTISGFAPSGGAAGATVIISGTGFQANPTFDKMFFNGVPAPLTAATPTSLTVTVPNGAASGPIQVITPFGSATSTDFFVVPPTGFVFGDVLATGKAAVNGGSIALSASAASKPVLAFFNGVQGDRFVKIAVQASGGGTAQVLDPHGVLISVNASVPVFFVLPTLTVTGTYTVVYVPSYITTATITVTTPRIQFADLSWSHETDTAPTYLNTAATQGAIQTFSGAVGQLTEIDLKSVSGTWIISVINSAQVTLWTSSLISAPIVLNIPALPADDDYSLIFDPGLGSGQIGYIAGIAGGTVTVGNSILMSGGGPHNTSYLPTAKFTFSGTAGQYLTMSIGTTRGFYYGFNMYYMQGTTRTCFGSCGSGGSGGIDARVMGQLPVTGTYTGYLSFNSTYPSQVKVALWGTMGLSVGAGASPVSIDKGGYVYRTFSFSGSGPTSFHLMPASCSASWQLLRSTGVVQNTSAGFTTGVASLGTLPAGSYTLVTNVIGSPYAFPTPSGTPPVVHGFISSGNWISNVQSCSAQFTSP